MVFTTRASASYILGRHVIEKMVKKHPWRMRAVLFRAKLERMYRWIWMAMTLPAGLYRMWRFLQILRLYSKKMSPSGSPDPK